MPVKNDSTKIVEQSQVTGSVNTFILGNTDKRVTFSTQQTRAFNLVWALWVEKIIKKKSKVAVIGGGLAGMTAAAALNIKGASVTLYHDKENLMNVQEKSVHRYIHPNIYDWPQKGCEIANTDFPCMNWSAAFANRVLEQIEDRWNELKDQIEILKPEYIDEVKSSGGKPRIYLSGSAYDRPFDCIIIASGFGIEAGFPNTRTVPYWHPDDLDVSTKTRQAKHYLVSGCGDGGLIDVLRLKIKGFNHQEFSQEILENADMQVLKPKLIEIEKNAPDDEENYASYISDEFRKLTIPPSLLEDLQKKIRLDTKVELNGSRSTPMSPKACLINRFSIFLLMHLEQISYKQARIVSAFNNGQKYVVDFVDGSRNINREYDDLIVRHGPKSTVYSILGAALSLPEVAEKDKIIQKKWPDGFYPKRTEEDNIMSKANEHLDTFRNIIRKADRKATITVMEKDGKEFYLVSSEKYQTPALTQITHHRDIEVKHREPIDFTFASGVLSDPGNTELLSLGSKVLNDQDTSATLGCFVSLPDQRIAFLTSAHLFNGNRSNKLYFYTKCQPKMEIGKLIRKSSLKVSTNVRRQKNIVDAALVHLFSNIPYSRAGEFWNGQRLTVRGLATAKIGDRVYKIGAGSGMTRGEVIGIHSSVVLSRNDQEYYFEDAIMVHSLDGSHFAKNGDSGAMVFREDGKILGMIFATSGNAAVLCPMESILKELQCSLLLY